ncbi:hypothetical protein GCM10009535_51590 [Streptomyces thermocarboxydovorans]|uniref:Uncharacterized protein n=1 Tax=Streptomyces thermocarboxydovorans TaxID=59298 RepID=A0ABN1HSJ9_9ACTN
MRPGLSVRDLPARGTCPPGPVRPGPARPDLSVRDLPARDLSSAGLPSGSARGRGGRRQREAQPAPHTAAGGSSRHPPGAATVVGATLRGGPHNLSPPHRRHRTNHRTRPGGPPLTPS